MQASSSFHKGSVCHPVWLVLQVCPTRTAAFTSRQKRLVVSGGCYLCIPKFPHQRAFSTEPMAAGLEERPLVEVRSAVLSRLFAGLAVRVLQKEIVLQCRSSRCSGVPRPDTSLTERWLVPAPCSGRPWLGPNLVKVYQSELFAAITEGVVLCAHFKLSSDPPACADDSQADAEA